MRKLYSLFAVVLVLAFLAAACAQPTPETIVETVVVEKEVEVVKTEIVEKEVVVTQEVEVVVTQEVEVEVEVPAKVLVFNSRLFSPAREQEFFIGEIIKPFEEEHGVTVLFSIIDDATLLERAEIQQTTGNITSDIVVSHNGSMPDWLDAGWVEDLTPLVE